MEPIITFGIITGGLAVASSLIKSSAEQPIPEVHDDGEWIHPLPRLIFPDGSSYNPVISDGFKGKKTSDHRRHMGVDLDYQKKGKKNELPQYKGLPDLSSKRKTAFFFPPDVPVRAARNGIVWTAKLGGLGHFVTIIHEHGHLMSFYQHLAGLRPGLKRGMVINAGTVLGPAGYNPNGYKFRHLHFEIRKWIDDNFVSVNPEQVGGKGLKNFPVEFEHYV